jgi:FkbM family methyltransferase
MLLSLEKLKEKYNLEIKGVIHVGAHFGQEFEIYEKLGIDNLIFFEPMPKAFEVLTNRIGNKAILSNVALGNIIGEMEMFTEVSNEGMSNSLLEPDYHLYQHPNIQFSGRQKVPITKLDVFMSNQDKSKYNCIIIDVQGYELEVFKGASNYLNDIDYIMTEVNREELYKGCARVEDLDSFLLDYKFKRVETTWDGISWGDAFYVKG